MKLIMQRGQHERIDGDVRQFHVRRLLYFGTEHIIKNTRICRQYGRVAGTQSRGRFRCLDSVKVDYGTLELLLHWRIARNTCLWRHLLTRNQYASPPEGNAIPTGHVHAIITKSCVVEGFVTQRPKTLIRFSYLFPLNFAELFVPGK